jgi:hypothetical protein
MICRESEYFRLNDGSIEPKQEKVFRVPAKTSVKAGFIFS